MLGVGAGEEMEDQQLSPAGLRGVCDAGQRPTSLLAPPPHSSGPADRDSPDYLFTVLRFQAYFLRAGSEMICHYRHNDRTSPTAPRANPNMAGKPFNPLVDFLNSELFTSTRFSSVEK